MSLDKETFFSNVRFLMNEQAAGRTRQDKIDKIFDVVKCFLMYPQHWKDNPVLIGTMKRKLAMLYSHEHVMGRRLYTSFTNFVNREVLESHNQCLVPKSKQMTSENSKDDFTVNFCKRRVRESGDRCWHHRRIESEIDIRVNSGIDVTRIITEYAHM